MAELTYLGMLEKSSFQPNRLLTALSLNTDFKQPLTATKAVLNVLADYYKNYGEEDKTINILETTSSGLETALHESFKGITRIKNDDYLSETGLYLSKEDSSISSKLSYINNKNTKSEVSLSNNGIDINSKGLINIKSETNINISLDLSETDYSKVIVEKNSETLTSQMTYQSLKNGVSRTFDFDKVSDLLSNSNYNISNDASALTITAPQNKVPQIKFVDSSNNVTYLNPTTIGNNLKSYYIWMHIVYESPWGTSTITKIMNVSFILYPSIIDINNSNINQLTFDTVSGLSFDLFNIMHDLIKEPIKLSYNNHNYYQYISSVGEHEGYQPVLGINFDSASTSEGKMYYKYSYVNNEGTIITTDATLTYTKIKLDSSVYYIKELN